MTETKRPLKVFLCHAHSDKDAVKVLYERLTNDGVDAWLDKENLLPGQNWRHEIRRVVKEADVVVVCHSKGFNQEGFRQREVRWALDAALEKPEGEIFIIPARLEECDVLETLSDWHWVELFEDDGYEMLMRALRARANNIGATLQIKRSWLPKITSPLPKKQKPVENKTTETSDEKLVNNVDGMSPSPELPDNWEAQWQGAFVKKAKEEKDTVETTYTKVDRPSAKKIRGPNTALIVSFIVLVMASIFGLPSLFDTPIDHIPTATQTKGEVVLETQTLKPSSTPSSPTSTKTPSFTATPTPLPTEITDAKGVSMMLVPKGEFIMGSVRDDDENPVLNVYLDDFYIDKYEVTTSLYKLCEDADICPKNTDRFNSSKGDDFPVVSVTWFEAKEFCEWRGATLPTEAQWEKSARGVDGRTFPWGEGIDCSKTNYWNCGEKLMPIGSFPNSVSPYGIFDMAGNINEWVLDWYSEDYYKNSSGLNPLGPSSGEKRVYRGGAYQYPFAAYDLRTSKRFSAQPYLKSIWVGFRCAKNVTP